MKCSVVAVLFSSVWLAGQTTPQPISVSACEVAKNPQAYAEKRISVRGRIARYRPPSGGVIGGFLRSRDFSTVDQLYLEDEDCAAPANRLQLALPEKHTDNLRDSGVERLDGLMQAFRLFTPWGEQCGHACMYEQVTATVTGQFVVPSLFGVEAVSDFKVQRTRIPFGGAFQCEHNEWRPTSEQLEVLRSSRDNGIAEHWHDPPISEDSLDLGSVHSWTSPDLSRRYSWVELSPLPPLINRNVCRPVSAGRTPNQATGEIRCRYHAEIPSKTYPQGTPDLESTAKGALVAWAKELETKLPEALTSECEHSAEEDYDHGSCSFATVDGFVSVSISLARHQKESKSKKYVWSKTPWTVTNVEASFCSTFQ